MTEIRFFGYLRACGIVPVAEGLGACFFRLGPMIPVGLKNKKKKNVAIRRRANSERVHRKYLAASYSFLGNFLWKSFVGYGPPPSGGSSVPRGVSVTGQNNDKRNRRDTIGDKNRKRHRYTAIIHSPGPHRIIILFTRVYLYGHGITIKI